MARTAAIRFLSIRQHLDGSFREALKTPRVQCIYLHHVFSDEERQFRKILQVLSEHHTFISHSEAVQRVLENRIDRPYISFSSDDGMENNVTVGKILSDFGARACFFINPAIVGEADIALLREHCARRLRFPLVKFLDWKQVEILQSQGHEIGSHTMTHIDIGGSSKGAVREELMRSYEILSRRCGAALHFAFPFGTFANFSEFGRRTCFEVGFSSCASAVRGCHVGNQGIRSQEDLLIRRDQLNAYETLTSFLYFLIENVQRRRFENNFPYAR